MQMSKVVAAVVTSLAALSCAASTDQEAGPPSCSAINGEGVPPLDGVRLVSPGHISPGAVVHPEFQPGQACTRGRGNPAPCASDARAGTPGVLIRRFKSWACVALPGAGKIATRAVWIPESRWVQDRQAAPASWVGIWQNESAKITIASRQGRLHVVGAAVWQGPLSAAPRLGSFEFDAAPDGDTISLSAGCEVRIRRVGEFLFAQDNQQCGSMNVTFDGLYRFRSDLRPWRGRKPLSPRAVGR